MDQDKQRVLGKLINVLERMARSARMNQWSGSTERADAYSIDQYNRILERLNTLDPEGLQGLFAPLAPDATWTVLANACRDLAAYYEDESGPRKRPGGGGPFSGIWTDACSGIWIDKMAFQHGL